MIANILKAHPPLQPIKYQIPISNQIQLQSSVHEKFRATIV